MTVDEMRTFVANCYPGAEWKNRVEHMDNGQVIAIYFSKLSKSPVGKSEKSNYKEPKVKQLSMFD